MTAIPKPSSHLRAQKKYLKTNRGRFAVIRRLRVGKVRRGAVRGVADRLCSALALIRDPVCVTCGRLTPTGQCGHFFGRIRHSVRWDSQNIAHQCSACNIAHNSNPEPLREATLRRIGSKAFEELRKRATTVGHPPLEEITAGLRLEIQALPRWGRLSENIHVKVLSGKFSNSELSQALK